MSMTAADRLYERIRHDRELQSLVIEAAAEEGGPFGGAITHVTECVADVLSESAREMEHNRRMIRQSAEDTQLASDLYEAWSYADQEASIEDVAETRWRHLTGETKARVVPMAEAIRKAEGACVDCRDEYGADRLDSDGRCEGCVHEREGLCRCGNEARPGSSMCQACAYETAGCERYHAMAEEGLA
jgi:hypothetical protein